MSVEQTTTTATPESATLNAGNLATPTGTVPAGASAPVVSPTPSATPPAALPTWNQADHEEYVRLKVGREQHETALRAQQEEVAQAKLEAVRKTGDAQKLMDVIEQQRADEKARLKQEADARVETERQASQRIKDDYERRLQVERDEKNQTETAAARYALDGELARAIAANPNLVPGGADQLTQLWRSQFSAVKEGGTYVVRNATGQTPADFATAQLARPEYAHFVVARNSAGGTGGVQPSQQNAPSATGTQQQPEGPPAGMNFGQTLVHGIKTGNIKIANTPGTIAEAPATNIRVPMGFKRIG